MTDGLVDGGLSTCWQPPHITFRTRQSSLRQTLPQSLTQFVEHAVPLEEVLRVAAGDQLINQFALEHHNITAAPRSYRQQERTKPRQLGLRIDTKLREQISHMPAYGLHTALHLARDAGNVFAVNERR